MLSWLVALSAFGASTGVQVDRLRLDLEEGLVRTADVLYVDFLRSFEPESVPERYALEGPVGGCATGLVADLKGHWDELDADQRATITRHVAPWKTDLMAAPPAPPPPGDACFSFGLPNQLASDHFLVEYDSNVPKSTAKMFADSLEYALEKEVGELGWLQPAGMGDYKMLAVIQNGSQGGAYTTVEACGGFYMPYIVTGKDSFWSDWYLAMAAHEFNHAIQYRYGMGHEFWFWEATATYAEEDVYPSQDSWADYVTGYTDQPWIAMGASSQQDADVFWHMYGMAIWPFYLDNHVGDLDLVQEVWEYSRTHGTYYDLNQKEVLKDLGYDFSELYRGFMAANTVMDYDDHGKFPSIAVTDKVRSLPAEGGSEAKTRPQTLGQNYIRFDVAAQGTQDLDITFEGDENGAWEVVLVGASSRKVEETVALEITDGVGQGTLADFGRFEQVWMVVSPTRNSNAKFDYDWTAEAVSGVPVVDDGGVDGANGDGASTGGCGGCNGTGPVGGWALLPLLALARRRTGGGDRANREVPPYGVR